VAQIAPPADGASLSEAFRAKLANQEDELKRLRRELDEMRMKSAAGALDEAVSRAIEVKGVRPNDVPTTIAEMSVIAIRKMQANVSGIPISGIARIVTKYESSLPM